MKVHKYRVGQMVHYRPARGVEGRPGNFKVERLLPPDGNGNQYRVESMFDGHRRVVWEAEITLPGAVESGP